MSEIGRALAMVLGVGLVIFVHEFGHFLAARLCRVRVEVFSLGFGPRLFSWRRGATLYQLALLPLGGYVRMAGEDQEPGRAPAPHELQAKGVGQRFFIYSGGVLMNVVFALCVFPVVLAVGVPMTEPIVGATEPGGPAWHAGVQPGSRVLAVNGHAVIGFDHIGPEVALGPSESTALTLLEPGASEPRTLEIPPIYSKSMGIYALGMQPAYDREGAIDVSEDSPAWKAGLRPDDRLLSVAGAPPELPVDEQLSYAVRDAGALDLVYRRPGEPPREAHVQVELTTTRGPARLGVAAFLNWVFDLRESAAVRALGLRKDDRILSVNGVEVRGEYDLLVGLRTGSGATRMLVQREGAELELSGPALDPQQALALFRDVALRPDGSSARVWVQPQGAAAEAGMQSGDLVVAVDGRPIGRFDDLTPLIKESGGKRALPVVVRRGGGPGSSAAELTFSILPRPAATPVEDYGIRHRLAVYTYQAPSPGVALKTGIQSSWRLMADSWLTLKRIMTGQVSGENVGGIITIGVVSYNWAAQGLPKLFYFLCMLSVSLAFLNVLPIPVLDGGHLFFLLIEKLKGSPVSERVLSYSQIVGLVLIVSLVVYVTFNDIQRWIFRS
jgi:regulator of sigma E protease